MVISKIKNKLIENPVVGTQPYFLIKHLYYLYMLTTILSADIFIGQAWEDKFHWFGFYIIGSYYLIFSINLLLGLFILYLSQYYLKCKVNKTLICIELVCLIGILVSSLSFPSHFEYRDKFFEADRETFIYDLSLLDRMHYLFSSLLLLLFFYVSFTYIPKVNKKISSNSFYYIIIGVCIVAIIYSLIFEFDIYKGLFHSDYGLWEQERIKSFLGNKNVYGLVLLYGMISAMFLEYETRHTRFYLLSLVFFISMFFSQCKTSILVGFLLAGFYAWFALLSSLKDKRRRNIYIFTIVCCLTIFFLLLFIPNSLSGVIKHNFKRSFDWITNDKSGTFNSRKIIRERILALLLNDPVFFIFGIGNYQFNYVSYFCADVEEVNVWQAHNGFYMALGEGGLIRLTAYLILSIYLIKILIIKIFKEKNKFAILLLAFLTIFEIRSVAEPEYFLSATWSSIFFTYLICLPILGLNEKESQETTLYSIKQDFNLQNLLLVASPSLIALGFVSNKIWFCIPVFIVGIILQSLGFYLCNDKGKRKSLFIYSLSLEGVLLLTALILKLTGLVNLATVIEFGIYAFVLNISSLFLVLNLGLIQLSFVRWTNIENRMVK